MKRLLLISLLITCAGCSSIPLSTMWEFRSFGTEEFLSLNPEDIMARVQLDEPTRADIEKTKLSLELSSERGVRSFDFPLVLLKEERLPAESGLFSKTSAKKQYSFQLTEGARKNFRLLQHEMLQHEPIHFHFNVQSSMESLPEDVDEIRLSLFLKLSEETDFIPMLRNAKLKVKRE